MAAYEMGLELIELVGRNSHVGELPEAGVDAVNSLPRLDGSVHQPAAVEQGAPGRGLKRNPRRGVPGNPNDIFDGERFAVENAD